MQTTIDATGLSDEAIRAVEEIASVIRKKPESTEGTGPSIFDLIGKAERLRSGEEIARQVEEERESWGEP